jgi:hypothetical protein
MGNDNKRRSIRFLDPDSKGITLSYFDENNKKKTFPGLIRDESKGGMACVYVGKEAFELGKFVFWEETKNISTPCEIVRCIELAEDVYCIGLKI